MKSKLQLLTSVGFQIGLFLLLLNDFILKEAFHNGFTGKLSDFAGMFIFPLFWLALFPRYKRLIFISSALFFIWWKSPLSQGIIDLWNSGEIFQIGRVVDYSDLWALVMLPVAWWYVGYVGNVVESSRFSLHPIVPICVACFAFVATTKAPVFYNLDPPQEDSFSFSVDSLKSKLYFLPTVQLRDSIGYRYLDLDSTGQFRQRILNPDTVPVITNVPQETAIRDSMDLRVMSITEFDASIAIHGDSNSSSISLYFVELADIGIDAEVDLLLGYYNEMVIEELRK